MDINKLEQPTDEVKDTNPLEAEIKEEQEVEKNKKEPKAFEGPELSLQEKARYADLITNVEKMKIIDDLDTHLPSVDPSELTRADLDILEKYLKIRRAGFKPEAVSAFENELSEIQLKPEEQGSASHSFLAGLRNKVSFQANERFKREVGKVDKAELKTEAEVKTGDEKTKYQQKILNKFWEQFNRLKVKDSNTILQSINHEDLGEEEEKIWKKFKQFTHEGWPKIRIPEFKRLLSEHESIIGKLNTKKGEADKAKSIKYFIEYLGEEVDKENEKSEA